MKNVLKHTLIVVLSFPLVVVLSFALIGIVFTCVDYFGWGDMEFEEVNNVVLTVPESENLCGCSPIALNSWVMSSSESLELYLHQREASSHLPLEGDLNSDSLDFSDYDYVFSPGYPILRMKNIFGNQCSSYESDSLYPLVFEFGEQVSRKAYIYKIKPQNKYRTECELRTCLWCFLYGRILRVAARWQTTLPDSTIAF